MDTETRLTVLEMQMGRFVSDIESEKETRARSNERISEEIKELRTAQQRTDRIIYMGLGGLAVVQILLTFLHK